MQVPEKLSLIGGSILLASTLVFTLKSQASSIIPNVSHSISGVFDHIGDAQKSSDFDDNFKQAQQKGWTTSTWGNAKYYIDDKMNMYVGNGQLQGTLSQATNGKSSSINTLNFLKSVQAPQDSNCLLSASPGSNNNSLHGINGLENMDTSSVQNMENMFISDFAVSQLNISNWDTSNVTNMGSMFFGNNSVTDLNLSHWDTHNVNNMERMFWYNQSLTELNLSSMNSSHIPYKYLIFDGANIQKLTLGSDFQVKFDMGLSGNYKNDSQSLSSGQLQDNNTHPGTWIKQ